MKGSCLLPVLTVLGGAQGNLEAHLGLAPAKCPPPKHTLGPAEKSLLALDTCLGLLGVPCPDSTCEFEELRDAVAAQVTRFSAVLLAQQTVCNSLCMLIVGPREQRQ